jgi:hypothetical protein
MIPFSCSLYPVWNHAGQALPASYDVNMQMVNFLPPYAPGIDNGTKAITAALLRREPRDQYHHISK